ncbi:hypothetical protein BD626DRAFT_577400 [Schizophyllum amplum]|uniref:Uncharacterized protein n=1 Tax=Schizophyllum amplum TaxID=97359 RepID=A0A550BSK1_9AGAR|nr:hypothetical protein BD626DRAFT_577400 [Auriculariopsis ampla]
MDVQLSPASAGFTVVVLAWDVAQAASHPQPEHRFRTQLHLSGAGWLLLLVPRPLRSPALHQDAAIAPSPIHPDPETPTLANRDAPDGPLASAIRKSTTAV